MAEYPLILSHLLNTPLLAHADKAETVASVVLRRAGVEVNVLNETHVNTPKAGPVQEGVMRQRWAERGEKTYLFADGVAVIEVTGSLAHRQWHVRESSGVMGYDGIGAQLGQALSDPDVKSILFDVHSAGGEVAGCFQLADRIYQARHIKPIIAISDEMAYSAAYAIASACSEVYLASDTAGVGSVGAVAVHFSFEKWLKNEGVKPTIFRSGARKAEGHPFEDLDRETVERFQAEIDALGEIFVRRVSTFRQISESTVKSTEAGTFRGLEAVEIGFADGIATPEEVFAALAS